MNTGEFADAQRVMTNVTASEKPTTVAAATIQNPLPNTMPRTPARASRWIMIAPADYRVEPAVRLADVQ